MALRSRKPLTLAQQDAWIRLHFPQFRFSRKHQEWIGTLSPTDASPTYQVRITYPFPKPVKVEIIMPTIRPDAPHLYSDDSLCLYYSKDPEEMVWHLGKRIADTIIPWTAEWLSLYERWLLSGVWEGESAPHTPRHPKKRPR